MIINNHEKFSRAVVELARKHKVRSIDLTFSLDSYLNRDENWHRDSFNRVRATWCQGRHGDPADINLTAEANHTITEKTKCPHTQILSDAATSLSLCVECGDEL